MKGFTVKRENATLTITQKKRYLVGFFLLFFSFFWLGFSGIMLLVTKSWFLVLFMLIGFVVFYLGLLQLFNKRRIILGPRRLVSKSGPLPTFGNIDYDIRQVDQLFLMEDTREKVGNKITPIYALKAKMHDETIVVLVRNIRNKEEGLELEKLLEDQMGIEDRALENMDSPQLARLKEMIPALEEVKLPGPINDGKLPKEGMTSSGQRTLTPRLIEGLAQVDVFAARLGDTLHWEQQDWVVSAHEQFDWSNKLSDLAFELNNGQDNRAIYAESTGNKYLFFEERALSAEEAHRLGFINNDVPVNIVENGEDKFYRRNEVDGYCHLNHANNANLITQWIYFQTTGDDRFRVVKTEKEWKIYIQELVPEDNLKVAITEKIKRGLRH